MQKFLQSDRPVDVTLAENSLKMLLGIFICQWALRPIFIDENPMLFPWP